MGKKRGKYFKPPKREVPAIECGSCQSIMFTRCSMDERTCVCGSTSIKGLNTSEFTVLKQANKSQMLNLKIRFTEHELLDDYLSNEGKLGLWKAYSFEMGDELCVGYGKHTGVKKRLTQIRKEQPINPIVKLRRGT